MTSSLVGSEMCIRDRCDRAPQAEQSPSQDSAAKCLVKETTMSTRQWPVSYTHLTLPTICSV
eukprot:4708289-Prorocentrum_lima.AAC.1